MPSSERIRSTWRRSAGRERPSRVLRIRIVSPATVTTPSSGVSSRLMQRSSVLLPEPEEPRMEITSPSRASSETPLSTSSEPKRLCRPETVSAQLSLSLSGIPIPSGGPCPQMRGEPLFDEDESASDQVVDDKIDHPRDDQRGVGDQRIVA